LNLSEGNSRDFEELFKKSFEKHFEGLFLYAHTLLRDEERSKDVVQGVFAKWCETKKIPGDVDACKAYLYTSVYRRSLNAIRDNKNEVSARI
jgi:RNA polymerase sigma-70 factor, ECF subfamily